MDSSAQMACVFKVNSHCDGCKWKVMEVLQNLKEQGAVKVHGKVNPSVILSVFDKYGKHGEVSSLRFDGEVKGEIPYHCYGENAYVPYEMIYTPYPLLGDPKQLWYGRNQYLMPLLPPPLSLPQCQLPPPRPPLFSPQPSAPLPPPASSVPRARPSAAPPPENPHCCTIM